MLPVGWSAWQNIVTPPYGHLPGRCVIDPDRLWDRVCRCCGEAIGQAGDADIIAVGVTGHGIGLYHGGRDGVWAVVPMGSRLVRLVRSMRKESGVAAR